VEIVDVLGPAQQGLHDRKGDRPGQALAGARELTPDRRARLAAGHLHEPVIESPVDLTPVAQQPDRLGPDVLGRVVEELHRRG
jgi:hypothetical protein